MVDLAMSIFEMLTKFLVLWHPWHPWVCIRSDLKQIWAIPPTVAATGSLILNKIDPFWTMCSGGAAQPAAASIAGKKK